MEKFPPLQNNQVALMRADTIKGYVLDELFMRAGTSSNKIYTVMNSFEDAEALAKDILANHQDIECVIYDKNEAVLLFLRPEKYRQ